MILRFRVVIYIVCIFFSNSLIAENLNNLLKIYAHRQNYLLPYTKSNFGTDKRQKHEAKFQFSIRKPIIGQNGNNSVNLAYTQKSLWQLYNADRSREMRENNYNPEVFFRTAGSSFYIDLGYEHESNGGREPDSRGWDRAFIAFNIDTKPFSSYLKIWEIINEEQGRGVEGRMESIKQYYGHGELELTFKGDIFHWSFFGRHNFNSKKGAFKTDITFPFGPLSLYLHLQYYKGYGESLIDYNRSIERFGFGVTLLR